MPIFIASPNVDTASANELSFLLFDDTGDSIAEGSMSFFKTILTDLGISETPLSWEMHVCRSDYFSDFAGENDWRDVWRTTWKAKVKTRNKIDRIPTMKAMFIESEAMDESWVYQKRVTENSITNCLIISDFDSLKELKNASDEISKVKHKQSEHYIKAGKKLDIIKIMDKYYQLQIDLGEVKPTFYSKGATDARIIQKICVGKGGTIHFQERMP